MAQICALILLYFWRKSDGSSDVLLNQIFFSSLVAGFLAGSFMLLYSRIKGTRNSFELYFLYVGLSFFIFVTIPLQIIGNVDRSRSLYMFNWIKCAPLNSSQNIIQNRIEETYGTESLQAFKLRLQEQEARGLVNENNGFIELSKRGEFIFSIAKNVSKIFRLRGWIEHDIWNNPKCLK